MPKMRSYSDQESAPADLSGSAFNLNSHSHPFRRIPAHVPPSLVHPAAHDPNYSTSYSFNSNNSTDSLSGLKLSSNSFGNAPDRVPYPVVNTGATRGNVQQYQQQQQQHYPMPFGDSADQQFPQNLKSESFSDTKNHAYSVNNPTSATSTLSENTNLPNSTRLDGNSESMHTIPRKHTAKLPAKTETSKEQYSASHTPDCGDSNPSQEDEEHNNNNNNTMETLSNIGTSVDYSIIDPIKTDFYFFAQEQTNQSNIMQVAQHMVPPHSGLQDSQHPQESLQRDPKLVLTALNEMLIHQWENESDETHKIFLFKEEWDWKRFMQEDVVRNKHCDTHTSRTNSKLQSRTTCRSEFIQSLQRTTQTEQDTRVSHSVASNTSEGEMAEEEEEGEEEEMNDIQGMTKRRKVGEDH